MVFVFGFNIFTWSISIMMYNSTYFLYATTDSFSQFTECFTSKSNTSGISSSIY